MATLLDTAKQIMSIGVAVIPIVYHDKKPQIKWSQFRGGATGSRLPTSTELELWFTRPANIGICTGWANLHVIDFDNADEYGRWLRWCESRGGEARYIARTAYRVRTRRGVHVYLRVENPVKHIAAPGMFDVQGNGRFVLGAGSIHPSGAEYSVLHDGFLPWVSHISKVLPAAALTQVANQSVPAPEPKSAAADDVWAQAMNAGATITGDLVTDIRNAFKIEDFVTGDRTRTGNHHCLTHCPLHDDETPSFWIDTQLQLCNCFSGCAGDKPLDVINLYSRLHGLTNREAILSLARRL